jgi:two-component system, chemotaxis family, sensor kinase CheA
MDELLSEFLTETGEGLDQLDVELVRFEQEPNNAEMLNTIFRLVHTVKGTCGFLGLNRLAKLAHAAETLMGQYRDGAPVTVEGVSVILASIDRIKQILSGLERDGAEPPGSDADLFGRLQMLALDEGESMPTGAYQAPEGGYGPPSMSLSGRGARRRGPICRAAHRDLPRTARVQPSSAPGRRMRAPRACASASIRSNI